MSAPNKVLGKEVGDLSEAQRGHQALVGGVPAIVGRVHRGLTGVIRRCLVPLNERGHSPAGGSNADLRSGKCPIQLNERGRDPAGGSNADLLPVVPAARLELASDRCVKAAHDLSATPACHPGQTRTGTDPVFLASARLSSALARP